MNIRVHNLCKIYRIPIKKAGLWASIRSLFARQWRTVTAVEEISFSIEQGEKVGFLGPNGAGKTTTLKMLTGLLHPSSGDISVLGYQPQKRHREFLKQITLVMGQKQQLVWDIPPQETFELNRALFDIPSQQYQDMYQELTSLLDIKNCINQPTRNLSLGQRMRCELAAALLHRPKILFLDEPTIGLDIEAQAIVRDFVNTYNQRYEATVVLTSHDMDDVSQIAERILLIDKGKIRFDDSLQKLKEKFGEGRKILIHTHAPQLGKLGFQQQSAHLWSCSVPRSQVNQHLSAALKIAPDAEITVMDPPLEEALLRAFGEKKE